jgi:hypothetical protein
MPGRVDLSNKRSGMLVAIKDLGSKDGGRVWLCKCDCGKDAHVKAGSFNFGSVQSCGCAHRENKVARHGHSRAGKETNTYMIWKSMVQRCTNKNNKNYFRYGGRGIFVCDEWRIFEKFLEDMGEVPEGKSLDRSDNNLGYSKENCKWVNMQDQANNKRNNHLISVDGVEKTMAQWAREIGVNLQTLSWRIHKRGFGGSAAVKFYMDKL